MNKERNLNPSVVPEETFSIEPHGLQGEYAIYFGRDTMHHGARLCNISDFDMNGSKFREFLITALNAYKKEYFDILAK